MFKRLFTIISLITAGVISYFTIDSWQEIWIFPLTAFATNFVCIIIFLFTAILLSLTINKNKTYNKYNKFYHYYLSYVLEYICCFCRVKVKVVGKEKIPKNSKYLMIQNHRSNFDSLITLFALKEQHLSVISKPDIFKIPVAGKLSIKNGFIPINRENNREGIKAIIRATEQIKTDEFSVMICPEGTRNRYDNNLLPFKSGSFKIAQKANVPIVLTSIDGTEKIRKRAPWKSTKVTLTIVDVISPNTFNSTAEMAKYSEEAIAKTLGVSIHTEEEYLLLKENFNKNKKHNMIVSSNKDNKSNASNVNN